MLLRQAEFWDKPAHRDQPPIPKVWQFSALQRVAPDDLRNVVCESPGLRVCRGGYSGIVRLVWRRSGWTGADIEEGRSDQLWYDPNWLRLSY
jgi:hypothetical protein